MTYRADGTSVVRATERDVVGIALAFNADMARRIAGALNESPSEAGYTDRTDPLTGQETDRLDVADRTALRDVLGDGRYVRVTGPYVTAEVNTPGGRQILGFNDGAILPGDVTAGHARHLIDVGLAKVVEAPSAEQAVEGPPSQRHRLEAAALQAGPTVGHPAPGTVAYDYERDPDATARSVYGAPPAPDAEAGTDDTQAAGGPPPAPYASKADWVDYAVAQGADRDEAEAKTQKQLVAEYGNQSR